MIGYIISGFGLHVKDSPGFLIHRWQASISLLAVRTQTFIMFWVKGISFIHDGKNQTNIHALPHFHHTHTVKKTFLKVTPTCFCLFCHSKINLITSDDTKTGQKLQLLSISVKFSHM